MSGVISILEEGNFPESRWDELGLKLHIIKTKLDAIKENHPKDVKACLRECLSLWLQWNYDVVQYGKPTMESFVAALRRMGLNAVASSVTQNLTMIPVQHGQLPLVYYCFIIITVQSEKKKKETHTLDSDVNKSLKRLRSTFSLLVAKIRSQLAQHIEDGVIKLIIIARYLEEQLRVTGLTGITCIDKLFNSIQDYYYYLNCSVIEHIVETFLIHNKEDIKLQEEMERYACELESFNESTKLVELQSAIHKVLPSSHSVSDTSCEVVLKFKGRWERETIKDLERFLQHYFVRNDLFNYIHVERGCIQVMFLVPRSYSQYLINMVSLSKIKSMYSVGVLQLVINGYVLLDNKDGINESLMEAVKLNDTFEVSVLLSLGADPYYKNDNGGSPMMLALLGESKEVKKLLLPVDERVVSPHSLLQEEFLPHPLLRKELLPPPLSRKERFFRLFRRKGRGETRTESEGDYNYGNVCLLTKINITEMYGTEEVEEDNVPHSSAKGMYICILLYIVS